MSASVDSAVATLDTAVRSEENAGRSEKNGERNVPEGRRSEKLESATSPTQKPPRFLQKPA
jgi:hypothetical protein